MLSSLQERSHEEAEPPHSLGQQKTPPKHTASQPGHKVLEGHPAAQQSEMQINVSYKHSKETWPYLGFKRYHFVPGQPGRDSWSFPQL